MASNSSPEVQSILFRINDLTTALANDPLVLAEILLSKDLISSEVYSKVQLHTTTPTEKVAFMLESARKVIEIAPEKFPELIEILSEVTCAKEVVESLRSTYQSQLLQVPRQALGVADPRLQVYKVGGSTPQERTLLACHDKLTDILSTHPVEYAYHLLAAGFISSSDHSKIMLSSLTPTQKAVMLMSAVREGVNSNPSKIHDFLQILLKYKSNRDVVKAIVQTLESEGFTTKTTPEFKSVSSPDPHLSKKDLIKIALLLQECSSKWKEIGTNLGFLPEELDSIGERPSLLFTSPDSYLQELLSQWVEWPTRYHPNPPTWGILCEALRKANLEKIAERLNKEMEIHGTFTHGDLEQKRNSLDIVESTTVSGDIKVLERQFSRLHRQLIAELKASSLSVHELVLSLSLLPMALRREYHKWISSKFMVLKAVDTIEELMFLLNPLLSFIDYDLLVYLAHEFGSDALKKDMDAYESDIKVFMKRTTIGQLMDFFPGQRETPPNFDVLKAKIGKDARHWTLEQINTLRRRYCAEVRLSEVVFCLIGLEESY